MRLTTIINEFEANFASSFIHTALVKYGIEFKTSIINDIVENLAGLKNKLLKGEFQDVHVGWEMTVDHVEMLEKYLDKIITAYKDNFFIHPGQMKVYEVNQKLREIEVPSLKEFTMNVIKGITIDTEKSKLTRAERIKLEADVYTKKWSMSQVKINRKTA